MPADVTARSPTTAFTHLGIAEAGHNSALVMLTQQLSGWRPQG